MFSHQSPAATALAPPHERALPRPKPGGSGRPWLPPRRRLRFRLAAGVALGLATILSVFTVLMAWAIRQSTDAAFGERLFLARTIARAEDYRVEHMLNHLSVLTAEVPWQRRGDHKAEVQQLLTALADVPGMFQTVGIVDARGTWLWQVEAAAGLVAAQGAEAGASAARGGAGVAAATLVTEEAEPVAVLATPLRNGPDDIPAAYVAALPIADLQLAMFPLTDERPGLQLSIVDENGNILFSSLRGNAPPISETRQQHLRSLVRVGAASATLLEPQGQPAVVVAFAPFQHLSGGIVMEEPADMALMVPRDLQRIGIFVGSATLLLLSLGAWWYGRRIAAPMEELADAARTIAEGNFDRALTGHWDDELGLVAGSFEEMRTHIKAAFEDEARRGSELERLVNERTETVRQLLEKVIAAQEEERRRVARDVHDGVVQDIAALLVATDSLEATFNLTEGQASLLRRLKGQAQKALQELRRLLLDLRPSALDDLGLAPAVRWFVETRCKDHGIPCSVTIEGRERRLPPATETALFRVAQEAVNNAIKHANAGHISMRLQFAGAGAVLTVQDDGMGFDTAAYEQERRPEALGLAGMRERALLVGGTTEIRSRPGSGTQVIVSIPMREELVDAPNSLAG